ncbi:serine hydrolase domain-containing protein [Pleionea sediminis]|uniref:serine hydrolase domain-containing protein n=1 Tax=Pleionea sediminis TaxID=2569479 RepID=UPI001186EA5A|nr:serine hydrolase domain-containing protein [Pleionea sediminis]
MKNSPFHFLLVFLFLANFYAESSESSASAVSPDALKNEAVKLGDIYAAMNWFNGSIEIRKNDVTILSRSWGFADRENKVKNTRDTLYNLGSIMKHFTAALVLLEIQNNRLKIDDRLIKFDLGFSKDIAEKVTIGHLLFHQSGFPDIFVAKYRENQLAYDTLAKRLTILLDTELLFEPGSERRYSNYGYVVLAAVLEKVTGKPFDELLKTNILSPLKLKQSFYPYPEGHSKLSKRYTFSYEGEQKFVGKTEHHGPDGGLEATISDVLNFYSALFFTDKILNRSNSINEKYFKFSSNKFGAFGGGAGVSTAVEIDLVNGYQIAVLSNSDYLVAERITGKLMQYLEEGIYEKPRLPPHVYAFKKYKELGKSKFKDQFKNQYQSDGYRQFIGRTLNELAISLAKEREWGDAINIIETLDTYFPKNHQVLDSMAYIYFLKGDNQKAKKIFKQALIYKPGFKSSYNHSGYGVYKAN